MTEPNEIDTTNFTGLLGMCEMEAAAKRIVYICQENNSWDTEISIDQMCGSLEGAGLAFLISHGWFDDVDNLKPSNALVERLSQRLKPTMPAKCPECGGEGCEKCDDGKIEVRFASGGLYTRTCLNKECGRQNGGRISKTLPPESSGPCVMCGGETEWELVGEM